MTQGCFLFRCFQSWLQCVVCICCLSGLLATIWGVLALYYSEIASLLLRYTLMSIFTFSFIIGVWRIYKKHSGWRYLVTWFFMLLAIIAYWSTILPSHERIWRFDMTRLPKAYIDGDKITITDFRNFKYRSLEDITPDYEERVIQLSHLKSVDFYISYWMDGPVAHTFISFNFDNASPVTISIEARYEEHENYDPLASIFKRFELIYIVGDEEDIVRVRSNFRNEDVYRYPLNISEDAARRLFLEYLRRVNELSEQPEFYHLLSNNCTINIVRYANLIGRVGSLDIRHILNGWSDHYLYSKGNVASSLPFLELREQAKINDLALSTDENGISFSQRIRTRLPSFNINSL